MFTNVQLNNMNKLILSKPNSDDVSVLTKPKVNEVRLKLIQRKMKASPHNKFPKLYKNLPSQCEEDKSATLNAFKKQFYGDFSISDIKLMNMERFLKISRSAIDKALRLKLGVSADIVERELGIEITPELEDAEW